MRCILALALLAVAGAFAPAAAPRAARAAVQMSAVDRRAALAGAFGALVAPAAALAVEPTDGVYYGKPNQTPDIEKFAPKKWLTVYPEKRVTLEKKSPYDRIDLSPPLFSTYHKVSLSPRAGALWLTSVCAARSASRWSTR